MHQIRHTRTNILHKLLAVPQPAWSISLCLLQYQRKDRFTESWKKIGWKGPLETTWSNLLLKTEPYMLGYTELCQAESFTPSLGNLFQCFTVLMVTNCSIKIEFPLKQPEPVAFCPAPVHPHEDSYLHLLYSHLSGRLWLDNPSQNFPLFSRPSSIFCIGQVSQPSNYLDGLPSTLFNVPMSLTTWEIRRGQNQKKQKVFF